MLGWVVYYGKEKVSGYGCREGFIFLGLLGFED